MKSAEQKMKRLETLIYDTYPTYTSASKPASSHITGPLHALLRLADTAPRRDWLRIVEQDKIGYCDLRYTRSATALEPYHIMNTYMFKNTAGRYLTWSHLLA